MPGGGFPLSELRAAVLSDQDWAPTQSAAFIVELDRFLWRAARRLVTLTPSLLWATERMWLQPELRPSGSATDVLRVNATDSLVLERLRDASNTSWSFITTSPGLYNSANLWVRTTAGITHRFRAHDFWYDTESGYERVSLDKPFPTSPSSGMTWRLFQDPWPMPPDVANVVDVRVWSPSSERSFAVRGVTERDMDMSYNLGVSATGSLPYQWCRGPSRRMQPPRTAPAVTNAGSGVGAGDDMGVWEYCYTIGWGIRDPDAVDPHGNYDPAWESSPSPVSAQATMTAGGGGAITVSWPALDYMLHYAGLPTTGAVRTFHSGHYIILYGRRVSDTETPPIDELAGFHRLAISADTPGSYVHDGSRQLVYARPLSAQAAVPTLRVWPVPNTRTEVDLRVVKTPTPMNVAADVLPVPPEAVEIVILDARRRLADKCKEYAIAKDIDAVQIPAAVKAALGVLQVDTPRTLIRGECDALPSHPLGYDEDELTHILYGYRS